MEGGIGEERKGVRQNRRRYRRRERGRDRDYTATTAALKLQDSLMALSMKNSGRLSSQRRA